MAYAGVAFTDVGGLEVASFPEVIGIDEERLFPESEMSKYCFEGIIGRSRPFGTYWNKSALLRQPMQPSCFTARLVQARNWLHTPFTP